MQNAKPILFYLLRLSIYAAFMVGIVEILKYDAHRTDLPERFSEDSLTELVQVIFLLAGAILCLWQALVKKAHAAFFISVSAFFAISFFREFNNFMNTYIFDSSWQIPVYLIIFSYLFYAYKRIPSILEDMTRFLPTHGFGVLTTGLLIVFIFSRLYGLHGIWMDLLGENYIRDVKNISEEGIELLGYGIMLLGVIGLLGHSSKMKSHQLNA